MTYITQGYIWIASSKYVNWYHSYMHYWIHSTMRMASIFTCDASQHTYDQEHTCKSAYSNVNTLFAEHTSQHTQMKYFNCTHGWCMSTYFLLNIQVGLRTQTHIYMHTLLSYLMSKERSYKCLGGKIIKDVIPHGYSQRGILWQFQNMNLFEGKTCSRTFLLWQICRAVISASKEAT